MLTSPVWRLLLSQRLRVERETPKRSWTSFLGMPRSKAESTFNLRSFEYAFMDTIFMQVHYLRKPLLDPARTDRANTALACSSRKTCGGTLHRARVCSHHLRAKSHRYDARPPHSTPGSR